jgi:Ni,Fe-hydrogenase III small subunit
MTASQIGNSAVINQGVVVIVNGYAFRALPVSRASHLYVASTFVILVNIQPRSASLHHIVLLMGVITKKMKTYDVVVHSVNSDFHDFIECQHD